jgi:hypothetical protein
MFAKQHQGKKMETAVTWCLTAASILIGVGAAIIWGSGSKSVGLWVGFVPGAIALVFAAGFQVQHLISKAELPEKNQKVLTALGSLCVSDWQDRWPMMIKGGMPERGGISS